MLKKREKYMFKVISALLVFCMVFSNGALITLADTPEKNQIEEAKKTNFIRSENNTRNVINFNDDWKFKWAGASNNPQPSVGEPNKKDYDDSAWRKISLPHDFSIELDFNLKNSLVGGEAGWLDGGTGWYRKSFTLPESMQGKKIAIYFGGVYMNSTVWVNGTSIGTYPNGYTPFTYDLTDQLIADGVTENVITVRAVNTQPSSRWYSGSGIYRNVDLIVTEPIHVANYGTYVTTPNIETENGGNVTVNIKTDVVNKSNEAANVTVRNSILNYKDDSVFTNPVTTSPSTIQAGETKEIEGTLQANNPKLWHTNEGNLYKIKTEILNNDVVVDTYYTDFGFRWFKFDKNDGFSLNGEYMKLKGVCMHHDQGALGSVANYRAIERQMDIMQEMGVNAIRVTHNPAADELIEICEKKGLLVIDEAFDTWYGGKKANDMGRFFQQSAVVAGQDMGMTWAAYDVKQMVERGKNSPAIIMWSIGNEIGEANGDAKSVETVKNLSRWVKEVDATRPVTMGEDKFRMDSNPNANFTRVQNELDVVGMNYAENNYNTFRSGHPDWVIYGSETSSATKSRGIYQHPDADGAHDSGAHPDYQQSSYDNDHVGWGKTASDSWIPDRDRKYIAGQFIWTGFDYIGEPTPWHNADKTGHDKSPKSSYFGIVDTAGLPKDDYYLYQSQWLDVEKNPMVHILPHWNWEDKELLEKVADANGKIPVRVYSNAKTIDLYQTIGNGSEVLLESKSFATKTTDYGVAYQQAGEGNTPADKKLYLEWRIPYKAGKLRAVAKNANGDIIAETAITSATQPAKIGLTADRQIIKADGSDLSYITVDINDAKGNVVPTGDNLVKFTIEGDGEIVGVDNGDAISHERYKAQPDGTWQRKAFSGKAIVIVKSTKKAGSFTLTATSRGLASNKIKGYTVESMDSGTKTLLGYNVQSSAVTKVNQQPELPKTVVALFSDSTKQEKNVTWDNITNDQLATSSSFELQGTVAGTNDVVKIIVQVKDIATVKEIKTTTALNTMPKLPDVVQVLYDDASKEENNVTWDTITSDQLASAGTFTVEGTISDITKLKAKATIRVVGEKQIINIAASAFGTKATATYVENNGSHPAKELNDGIILPFSSSSINGWGNWEQPNRTRDTVTFEFKDSYEVSSLRAYFLDKQTMTKPDSMIIKYWDEETNTFVPVENQDISSGFTADSGQAGYEGNLVTFDPITTNKISCEFTVAYSGSKNMLKVSEIEIQSFEYDLSMKKNAVLSDILLDGKSLEGFDGSNYYYEKELSYPFNIPVITATANDNASISVVQAIKADGRAVIEVTSEDGSNSTSYEIQFSKKPLQLTSLTIVPEKTTMIEDESVGFNIQAILEDGSPADPGLLNLKYDITSDDGGKIVIEGKDIQAYNKGKAQLVATAEYEGIKRVSDPIDFIIYENIEEKNVVSYEKLTVVTNKGEAPALPDKIQVYFDKGFSKEMDVNWDTIDPQLYNELGKFSVNGRINGQMIQPIITVSVNGVVEVQKFSGVTPVNFPPTLPKKAPVYMADGTLVYKDVTWDLKDVDLSKEGIVKVFGSLENDTPKKSRNAGNQVEMNLRITSDVSVGKNVAGQWTGSELPLALASNTNDRDSASLDRVEKLNDNNSNEGNTWTNWKKNGYQPDETVWVGILFGESGELTERSIDNMKTKFLVDVGCAVPSAVQIQYYIGKEVPNVPNADKRGHMDESSDDLLSKDENWADVKDLKYGSLVANDWSDFTFSPVRTYALRIKMAPQAGKSIGLNELQIFEKVAQVNQNFDINSITVNGKALDDFSINKEEYSLVLDNSNIPEVSVSATNNAAVTVAQATSTEGKARINITSEDGKLIKDYTINFTSPSAPKNIISIEDSQILSVSTGAAFDTISAPKQVEVTLDNGKKKKIDVAWDTTDYNENNVGVYILKGELELPEGVINKSAINPFLAVKVGSDVDVSLKPNFIRFAVKKDQLIQNEVVFPMIYAIKGAQYFIYESLDSKESIMSVEMATTTNSALSTPVLKTDGLSKDYQVDISGTNLIIKHATDVAVKDYYISVIDHGKLESPKTKITVEEADLTKYKVNLNQSQGGLITSNAKDGLIMEGLNLTLTFTPTTGYKLVEAVVNNKVITLDKNNQFIVENVHEDITVAAKFSNAGSSSGSDASDNNKVSEATAKAMSDAVVQAKKGDTATLIIKEGQSRIPDSILKLAKEKGVNLTFTQGDIICTIDAKDIKDLPEGISYDVGLKMITDTDISSLTKGESAVIFQLDGSGNYPFTMKLELKTDTKLKGKMMFVNRYNPETKRLEYVSVDDVDSKGIVIGTVNAGGKYVLSNNCGFVEKQIATITGKTNNTTGKSGKVTLKADLGSKDVTVKQLSWKSSNSKYASVDKNGVVTAKKAGKGKTISVTAAALDGSKTKKTFKVYLGTPVGKITVAKSNPKTVLIGEKTKIKYDIPTKSATNKNVVFSSNNKYVKIDKNGNMIASKGAKGKVVTITIKAKDGQGAKSQFKIKIK